MMQLCRDGNLPEPEFRQDGGQFVQTMRRPKAASAEGVRAKSTQCQDEVGPHVAPEVTPEVTPEVRRLLRSLGKGAKDRQLLQRGLRLRAEKNFRLVYLRPALMADLIEMTIPGKPRSSRQKYRLTEKGRAWLTSGRPGNGR